jgi:hypothetical protein
MRPPPVIRIRVTRAFRRDPPHGVAGRAERSTRRCRPGRRRRWLGSQIRKVRFSVAIAGIACVAGLAGQMPALAEPLPTGERTSGQSLIEVATNDADGSIVYLRTPTHVANPVNSNERSSSRTRSRLSIAVRSPRVPGTREFLSPASCSRGQPVDSAGVSEVSTRRRRPSRGMSAASGGLHCSGGHGRQA